MNISEVVGQHDLIAGRFVRRGNQIVFDDLSQDHAQLAAQLPSQFTSQDHGIYYWNAAEQMPDGTHRRIFRITGYSASLGQGINIGERRITVDTVFSLLQGQGINNATVIGHNDPSLSFRSPKNEIYRRP